MPGESFPNPGTEANMPPLPAEAQQPPAESLVMEDGVVVDRLFDTPEQKSATTIEYRVDDPEGLELSPGHAFGFVVPEHMKGRLVRDVILQHRKGEKYRVAGTKEHDPHGAYSRVELHDEETGQWTGWRDPKGYNPDKYAEWRPASDPENEVLHDWLATVGPVKPDAIRVTAVGEHPEYSVSQIHGVEVVFYPELEGVTYQETVLTPGTEFIDIEKGKLLPKYGGGSHTEGVYDHAIQLNGHGANGFELTEEVGPGVEILRDAVVIDLPAGQKLIQAEVAAGDTEHLDEINPKTGRHTRLGWAKLWVGIQRAGSEEVEWFVPRANVPLQGVIAGGPDLEHSLIGEGDKLVIQSRDDTSYLMGWRLAYEQPEDASPTQRAA